MSIAVPAFPGPQSAGLDDGGGLRGRRSVKSPNM
jgi:hypothetical protein